MLKSRWVGVDLSCEAFYASNGEHNEVLESDFKSTRRCGCYVAAALPASMLFVETIDIPASAKGRVANYLPSLLDVKLPFPIEECLIANDGIQEHKTIAFAVKKIEYQRQLDLISSKIGCLPERIVPAPLVLWRKAYRTTRELYPASKGAILNLHASTSSWTLLSGAIDNGRLESVLTVASGDIGAIARNVKILMNKMGFTIGYIAISGEDASDKIKAEIESAVDGLTAFVVSRPKAFLAEALVDDARASRAYDGNFAIGEFEHPASLSRRLNTKVFCAIGVAFLSLLFLTFAIKLKHERNEALTKFDVSLGELANRFSARSLGLKGPASIQLALNDFSERKNPVVAKYGMPSPLNALGEIFTFLEVRSLSVSSMTFLDGALTLVCQLSKDDNAASLKALLEDSGYSVELSPYGGIDGAFEIKISCVEGM